MIDILFDEPMIRVAVGICATILLKATIPLMAAVILSILFKRSSAAARNAMWSTMFVLLLFLPIVPFLIPSWQIGQIDEIWFEMNDTAGVKGAEPSRSIRTVPTSGTYEQTSGTLDNQSETVSGARFVALTFLVIWICGVLFILSRLAVHLLRVTLITRRAHPPHQPNVMRHAASIQAQLGIQKPVRFLVSEGVSMPFAWGVLRPVIVFPSEIQQWSEAQMRSVLLHELAHIVRWDYLFHILIEMIRALYWLNPLVWLGARWTAMERERACDDFALQNGVTHKEYASHLLNIARNQLKRRWLIQATTMAGENGFGERIRCVMNGKLNHSVLRFGKLILITCTLIALMLPLVTLDVLGVRWTVPSIRELLLDLEDHREPKVRQRAAWWLGEHEDRSTVMPLIEALRDESADVRQVAAWALGEVKDDKAIVPLIDALKDDDPLVREMAVLSLGEIEDPDAVDPLFDLSEKERDMRTAVVWALGEIENRGSRSAARARDRVFDLWEQRSWENDLVWSGTLIKGPYVKRKQGKYKVDEKAIGYTEDIKVLLRRLQDEDADVRLKAALNCGLIGIHDYYESLRDVIRVVDGLLETLRAPEPEVRAMAVWALDEINPSRSRHFHQDQDHDQ